ncbi:hypothetical protein EV215_0231 [Hypnocyclicus thermotrophus]|uniref:Uncharacterized protein n=1 Tax=Hypnocyclicus thermotrophus TaxID=1627895 RepID=A0AA46E099_9FUSO|nr:hypothetical protein [Hypnocyclicus thermotrophus]TDT72425.1 hypothetical protein EV215_0231 [Hypnocyclicus thermotrophus]
MIVLTIKLFLIGLLLNNFIFKYFVGIEIFSKIKNIKEFLKIFFINILLANVVSYGIVKLFKINSFAINILVISLIATMVYEILFKNKSEYKNIILLYTIFLYLTIKEYTFLALIIYAILNTFFIGVSLYVIQNLYDYIDYKSKLIKPELIYTLVISLISMIFFGFTGFHS